MYFFPQILPLVSRFLLSLFILHIYFFQDELVFLLVQLFWLKTWLSKNNFFFFMSAHSDSVQITYNLTDWGYSQNSCLLLQNIKQNTSVSLNHQPSKLLPWRALLAAQEQVHFHTVQYSTEGHFYLCSFQRLLFFFVVIFYLFFCVVNLRFL